MARCAGRAGWSTGSARGFAERRETRCSSTDVDDAARGRVFGFHRAMDTFGAVVGPLLGLAGYELLDHQIAPLLWVAVVPAVLSVALVFLVRETRRVGARAAQGDLRAACGSCRAGTGG